MDVKKLLIGTVGFLICLNILFMIGGLLSADGYTFDFEEHILNFIPIALMCASIGSFKKADA